MTSTAAVKTVRLPKRSTFHREFKPLGKLGRLLDQNNLSYSLVGTCAVLLRLQLSDRSRLILLEAIKKPARSPHYITSHLTVYGLSDWCRGKLSLENSEIFNRSIQLLGITTEEARSKVVSFSRISFASWALSVTDDPIVLAEVATALKRRFSCPVSAIRISKWVNGHAPLWEPSRALLIESIECLCPGCGEEVREVFG